MPAVTYSEGCFESFPVPGFLVPLMEGMLSFTTMRIISNPIEC